MKQPQQVFQCVDDTETSTGAEITAEAEQLKVFMHAQFYVTISVDRSELQIYSGLHDTQVSM